MVRKIHILLVVGVISLGTHAFGKGFRIKIGIVSISDKGPKLDPPKNLLDILPQAQVGPINVNPQQTVEEVVGIREKQRTEEAREELRNAEGELRAEQNKLNVALVNLQTQKDAFNELQQNHSRFFIKQKQNLDDVEEKLNFVKASLITIKDSNESFTQLNSDLINQFKLLEEQLQVYQNQVSQNQNIEFLSLQTKILIRLYQKTTNHLSTENSELAEISHVLNSYLLSNRDMLSDELKNQSSQISEAIELFKETVSKDENMTFISSQVEQVDASIEIFLMKIQDLFNGVFNLKKSF